MAVRAGAVAGLVALGVAVIEQAKAIPRLYRRTNREVRERIVLLEKRM